MRLPIPFDYNGSVVEEVDLRAPRAGVLADVQKEASEGRQYQAIAALVSGCLSEETEKPLDLVKAMPYRTVEYLALQAILLVSPDDGFEGVYECPRCGHQTVCELTESNDTRDFVSEVEVRYSEGLEPILVALGHPVTFTVKDSVDTIETIQMRHPTIGDCISAEARVGKSNLMKLQFAIYAAAIERVNGDPVNQHWKATFGIPLFEKMEFRPDLITIRDATAYYGMSPTIRKLCSKCGKEWDAPIDTSNFFGSALRSL